MVFTQRVARLAPLLVLALALAIGAAWFVGALGARPAGGPNLVHASAALSPELQRDASDLTQAPGIGLDPAREGGRSAAAVELAPEQATETETVAAPVDETPPQVVGRVARADGTACAGATVIAATGWVQSLPIEIEDLGQASQWLKRVRTETDEEGRFTIEKGLDLGGELILHVAAPGSAPLRLDRPPPGARGASLPLDYGTLTLRDGAVVRGEVVDRRGHAVPGARVALSVVHGEQGFGVDFPSRGVPLATSGDDGTFVLDQLERGPFTLLVEAPGRTVARATGVASARPIDHFKVVVEAGSVLAGKLVGRPTPADGAAPLRIEARPGKPDNSSVEGIERALGVARYAPIDASGAFELGGLVDGLPYTLVVSASTTDGRWTRVVEVDPTVGWPGTRGLEVKWNPRRVATLRIVDDATGAAVEDCHVRWRLGTGRNANRGNDGYQTLLDGGPEPKSKRRFYGGIVTLDQLPPGRNELEVSVRVTAVGYQTKTAEDLVVRTEGVSDLGEVRLTPAPTVRVTVKVEETGAPVAGAKVYLAQADYQWLEWFAQSGQEVYGNEEVQYGVTGEDGVALLASMPGKRVRVTAGSDQYRAPEPAESLLPLTGVTDVELKLTDGGTIVVHVRRPSGSPASGVKVYCRKPEFGGGRRQARRSLEQVTDAEGRARFQRLPPGLHEVSVSTEDQASSAARPTWRAANVVVGQDVSVVLDAPATGTLSGIVLEAGQPLARVTLSVAPQSSDGNEGNELNEFGWGGGWGGDGGSAKRASSRADGSYTLGPIATGEWTLTVRHGARAMACRYPIRIVEGANTFDVRLDVALLEGTVVDENGDPIPKVEARILSKTEPLQGGSQTIRLSESPTGDVNYNWDWQSLDVTHTAAEGRFSFRGVATARPLALMLRHRYVQPLTIELSDFADGELRHLGEIVAKGAGEVRVRRAPGSRSSSRLQLVRLPDEGAGGDEVVQATGNLRGGSGSTFSSLPPGRYRVELLESGGSGAQRHEVELVAGETVQVQLE